MQFESSMHTILKYYIAFTNLKNNLWHSSNQYQEYEAIGGTVGDNLTPVTRWNLHQSAYGVG
jgi:energy-converting hydrogenase Eha subunit F